MSDLPSPDPVAVELSAILGRAVARLQQHATFSLALVGCLVALNVAVTVFGYVASGLAGVGGSLVELSTGRELYADHWASVLRAVALPPLLGILSGALLLGGYRAFLLADRGGPPIVGMVWRERWSVVVYLLAISAVGATLLTLWTPSALLAWAFLAGRLSGWVLAVGGAVNLVFFLAIATFVNTFTQFLGLVIVDQGLGPWAALRETWRLTEGHRWLAFAMVMVHGSLLGFAQGLTFGLGNGLVAVGWGWVLAITYRAMLRHGDASRG